MTVTGIGSLRGGDDVSRERDYIGMAFISLARVWFVNLRGVVVMGWSSLFMSHLARREKFLSATSQVYSLSA